MNILKKTYNCILNMTPHVPPETGGIIGGRNGIITDFCADIWTSLCV